MWPQGMKSHKRWTRAVLALFAGFWLSTAAAPCVRAASACPEMPQPCQGPADPAADHAGMATELCPPVTQLGCTVADENLIKKPNIFLNEVPPAAAVLAYRPPEVSVSRTGLRATRDTSSIPASPPNLRYARLLI